MHLSFSRRELKDLGIAWVVLAVAFTAFFFRGLLGNLLNVEAGGFGALLEPLAIAMTISLATVGVAFLLHELAHKVVAVYYGQVAEFRADYSMLFLAVMAGLAGFLFAAPGAVYHRGFVTEREQGLIALAGPVTNVGLAVVFLGVALLPGPAIVGLIGSLGVTINLLLAGFNMIPFGPLDGRKVLDWSVPAYVVTGVPMIALGAWAVFG